MKNKCWIAAIESLHIEMNALKSLSEYMDKESFDLALDALASSNKIITCASGTSGIAAKKFAHSLCCIERSAMFMPPCEAVHGGLGALKKEDVMVMVSRGGKTSELLPVIDVCNKKGAVLIVVTENLDSLLGKNADIVLPIKIEKESDPTGLMATSSFMVTVALFDALLSALIVRTGYTREQFGLIHPGGAVGQLLNK
ncbi:MAG TPA: phosphosugar isomerase [Clostridiales bacterium]|nr:phosphosugar isomerase [Clostridiales bacterium]